MFFITYSVILAYYDSTIYCIFLAGSAAYSVWVMIFMQRRKTLDYELYEQQAENNNKIYQFITAMQEIKLQQCEQRRCNEWEEVQRNLYYVQRRVLALRQNEEVGSVFINEMKNLFVTVMAATAVINGDMTLGGVDSVVL
ncbi:ATP-binding cassette, subfamily B [Segatella baroniae B14]|nr:ATP-binding cassette, subfamily B [Segatella baroniae B14]